jgi:ATP-dependent exoDNAse (exonuclease V) alpha subunit
MDKKKIELNEQFKKALDVMEHTSRHVFVTGRAGTGKSTLLDYFRSNTKKEIVVLAPTGVAALNVKGQTIHSFFGFKPNVTLQSIKKLRHREDIYKEPDAIVIDEVSMVRADLMDCIDKFLRLNGRNKNEPFGGVQMIFIGDLYQLPPVVSGNEKEAFKDNYESPFFFDAKVMKGLEMEFIELEKIYRQKDEAFIALLNAIRNNSVTNEDLQLLNRRCLPDIDPDAGAAANDFSVWLTSTNEASGRINMQHLSQLPEDTVYYDGEIQGDFKQDALPTQINLQLKIGAQVMLLNNDPYGRWVNGSIGRITGIDEESGDRDIVIVELTSGDTVEVAPYTWELFSYQYDREKRQIESEVNGSFTQYPIKLAWAMTIHKSQGKTFEKVVIDIGKGTFATGQMYVALSRCTSLEGIVLKRTVEKRHIFIDWRIVRFVTDYQYRISDKLLPADDKIKLVEEAIGEKKALKIVYLKNNDTKSIRVITPITVGEMEYLGKKYTGVQAFCHKRRETRTFRIDRILEISKAD